MEERIYGIDLGTTNSAIAVFENDEAKIIIMSLVELKNRLIEEGRYTDAIDELIMKLWIE